MIGAQLLRTNRRHNVVGLALKDDKRMLMSNNDVDDILISTVVKAMLTIDQSIDTLSLDSKPDDAATRWIKAMPSCPEYNQFYPVQTHTMDITQFSQTAQSLFGPSIDFLVYMRDDSKGPYGLLQGKRSQYTVHKSLVARNGMTILPIVIGSYWR